MYRPFGDLTSEILEDGTYFVPGIGPQQIFRSNSFAGRSAARKMLITGLILECVAILLLILFSL